MNFTIRYLLLSLHSFKLVILQLLDSHHSSGSDVIVRYCSFHYQDTLWLSHCFLCGGEIEESFCLVCHCLCVDVDFMWSLEECFLIREEVFFFFFIFNNNFCCEKFKRFAFIRKNIIFLKEPLVCRTQSNFAQRMPVRC